MIRTAILIGALFAVPAFAAPDAAMKADNDNVNTACASDAQTAGCGSEQVGKGLLKCLHAYKKAHKDFKFSADCSAAMKTRHADKKAGK